MKTVSRTEKFLRSKGLDLELPIEWWTIGENNQLTEALTLFTDYSKEELFRIVRLNLALDERLRIKRLLELSEYENNVFGFSSLGCNVAEIHSAERKTTIALFDQFTDWYISNCPYTACKNLYHFHSRKKFGN